MSAASVLLRCYPRAWCARYGAELEELIVQASGGRRTPLRIHLDVVLAGGRERLRASGLTGDGVPPGDRSRAGSLLVLCAWVLFAVAGVGVQKLSEHWQAATPAAGRALPAAAFQALVAAAGVGSVLVLVGIAAALPSLAALVRAGGWRELRPPIVRALVVTAPTGALLAAIVVWAHGLTGAQRAGHDVAYELAVLALVLLALVCLAAWTRAAIATARRIDLPAAVLRLEAALAAAVTATMAAMTISTAVWWAALARSAPRLLDAGSAGPAPTPQLLVPAVLMLVATSVGAAGATRAVRFASGDDVRG